MGCLCSKPLVKENGEQLDENQIEVELVITHPEIWPLDHVGDKPLDEMAGLEKERAKGDIASSQGNLRSPMSVATPLLNYGKDSGVYGQKVDPHVFTFYDQLSPTTAITVSIYPIELRIG